MYLWASIRQGTKRSHAAGVLDKPRPHIGVLAEREREREREGGAPRAWKPQGPIVLSRGVEEWSLGVLVPGNE